MWATMTYFGLGQNNTCYSETLGAARDGPRTANGIADCFCSSESSRDDPGSGPAERQIFKKID